MPAERASAIAWRASGRGGSTMPTNATSVRSAANSRCATASTRRPRCAIRSITASTPPAFDASGSMVPCSPITVAVRDRSTSCAPLTNTWSTSRPSAVTIGWAVIMNLLAESNGSSARRAWRARSPVTSMPPLAASTTSARSVGSPTMRQESSSGLMVASLHNANQRCLQLARNHERDDRSTDQDQNQQVPELADEAPPPGHLHRLGQHVGTNSCQMRFRFGFGQAARHLDCEIA